MGNEAHENLLHEKILTRIINAMKYLFHIIYGHARVALEWILNVCYVLRAIPASEQLLKEIMKHRNETIHI